MKKFELLDRFELLYPLDKLAELPRLYIDKDLLQVCLKLLMQMKNFQSSNGTKLA